MNLNKYRQKDYAYMSARVSAKAAKLLDERDYENLLKMGPNEIARNLEEGEYKEEINKMGDELEVSELLEYAVRNNMAATLKEITELSPEDLKKVIETYTRKYDLQNIKRLLRWKENPDNKNLEDLIVPSLNYGYEEIKELSEKDKQEIISEIKFESGSNYSEELEDLDEISDIEGKIDEIYYRDLKKSARKTGNQKYIDFVEYEIENECIRTILRLKKYNIEKEEIESRLPTKDRTKLVKSILQATTLEKGIKKLREENKVEREFEHLEDVEHELERNHYEKALKLIKRDRLGITTIIGYIIAREVQRKNLRIIIQGKTTDSISNDEIKEKLVLP